MRAFSTSLRQHLAALRALLSSPSSPASPTRWSITAVAQLPGLQSRADGSLITVRRQGRRVDADRPVVHRQGRQPAAAVLPDPAVRGRRRLRPDRVQREQPRPGAHRRHPARPVGQGRHRQAEPAHPGLLAQPRDRQARRRRRLAAVLHRRRRRRGALGVRPRPGLHAARSTRVVSVNQACPATPFLATLQGRPGRVRQVRRGLLERADRADPRRRPGQPGGARRRRHRQRQSASTRTSARPTPTCRRRASPRPAASAPRRSRRWSRQVHDGTRRSASSASRASTCSQLNLALDSSTRTTVDTAARGQTRSGREQRRGQLRVYLGAAPGVGKTYAMLDEGHRRRARGTDVVVGFVETHGRPHTAEQARRPRGHPARRRSPTAARSSPRWTCRRGARPAPAGRARRRARPHQRARQSSTPSAGRTSRSCSTPASP